MSKALKKVTLFLPQDLIQKAKKSTGEGITQTVRKGLQLVASQSAFEGVRKLRGKIDLKLDLDSLRKDKKKK